MRMFLPWSQGVDIYGVSLHISFFRSMMQNVPAENNLLLESDFGPAVLDKLLHMPEIFRVQVTLFYSSLTLPMLRLLSSKVQRRKDF